MQNIQRSIMFENINLTEEIRQKYPERIEKSINESVKYGDVRKLDLPECKSETDAVISIVNEDSADAGYYLQKQGLNPLVLNMASEISPGGGWRKGSTAQEESLFYRSLYYLALENRGYYPLDIYAGIYTPDVFFFRSRQLDGYKLLSYEDCSFISCVAMPALRKPTLNTDGTYLDAEREVMIEKIRGIFKIAILNKHDSLVLGAFGCGAFGNNPVEVAKMFKEVLPDYSKYFKKIQFAILDYNGSKNLSIFKNILLN